MVNILVISMENKDMDMGSSYLKMAWNMMEIFFKTNAMDLEPYTIKKVK